MKVSIQNQNSEREIIAETIENTTMTTTVRTFIMPGNLIECAAVLKYSSCPECALNHPCIQGSLVFEALQNDSFIQSRAFYLLHIVMNNKRNQTQISSKRTKFERLSNQALAKSREFFGVASGNLEFITQSEEWCNIVFSKDKAAIDRDRLEIMTRWEWDQNWLEFEIEFNQLGSKYITESILLAKAAFHKLTVQSPKVYLCYANSQYYAEGYIQMGDYLATLAQCDLSKAPLYLDKAKEMYRKALLVFDDIRGFEHFTVIGGDVDEEMIERNRLLTSIHDELDSTMHGLLS